MMDDIFKGLIIAAVAVLVVLLIVDILVPTYGFLPRWIPGTSGS